MGARAEPSKKLRTHFRGIKFLLQFSLFQALHTVLKLYFWSKTDFYRIWKKSFVEVLVPNSFSFYFWQEPFAWRYWQSCQSLLQPFWHGSRFSYTTGAAASRVNVRSKAKGLTFGHPIFTALCLDKSSVYFCFPLSASMSIFISTAATDLMPITGPIGNQLTQITADNYGISGSHTFYFRYNFCTVFFETQKCLVNLSLNKSSARPRNTQQDWDISKAQYSSVKLLESLSKT